MTVKDVLKCLDTRKEQYSFLGNEAAELEGFCSLVRAADRKMLWVKNHNESAEQKLNAINGALVICKNDYKSLPSGNNYIICEEPKRVFFDTVEELFSQNDEKSKNPIGEGCVISSQTTLGSNVIIENNVTILGRVQIGNNCIIHSNTVIGTDGYGFIKNDNGEYQRVKHYGGVKIGSNVEIGANVCIVRGTIDDTEISDGVKIDNLCNIAHNCVIGKNVYISCGVMIAGSTVIEQGVYVAPGVIVNNQMKVGENSFLSIGAVVNKEVPPDTLAVGCPQKKTYPVEMLEMIK